MATFSQSKMKIRYVVFPILCAGIFWFIYSLWQPPTEKFSKDFFYDYESDSIFGDGNLVDVPPDIIDYAYDKNFLIVKQKPTFDFDKGGRFSAIGLSISAHFRIGLRYSRL